MIVVRLKGGMGNQMYQYAFGRALSTRKKTDLVLDKRFLEDRTPIPNFVYRNYDLDIFNINPVFKDRPQLNAYQLFKNRVINKIRRTFPTLSNLIGNYYVEKDFSFDPDYINLPDNITVDGYFQSFKYFEEIKNIIIDDFSFKYPISENCIELLNEIQSGNSVCINVRRGDFLTDKILGAKDSSYYNRGAECMCEKVTNPKIYVFSDDIEWCESNLKFAAPTIFVQHEFAGSKFRNYFELMINCKHFVIPNSSFGWWAAYLSPNKDKVVITPKMWFNDLTKNTGDMIPENWIGI